MPTNLLDTKKIAREITPTPRPISNADFGIKGDIAELTGTISMDNGVVKLRVDMIKVDNFKNPLGVMDNLVKLADNAGAHTLRIEGTLANEKLFRVLSKKYKIITEGANEHFLIKIK